MAEDKWSGALNRTYTPKHDTGKLKIVVKAAIVVEPEPEQVSVCCGCGVPVNPGFCYYGKALESVIKLRLTKDGYGADDSAASVIMPPSSYVLDGVPRYKHGFLCDTCGADYHTVDYRKMNGEVVWFPVVVIRPGLGPKPKDEISGSRSYKGFNTRITR